MWKNEKLDVLSLILLILSLPLTCLAAPMNNTPCSCLSSCLTLWSSSSANKNDLSIDYILLSTCGYAGSCNLNLCWAPNKSRHFDYSTCSEWTNYLQYLSFIFIFNSQNNAPTSPSTFQLWLSKSCYYPITSDKKFHRTFKKIQNKFQFKISKFHKNLPKRLHTFRNMNVTNSTEGKSPVKSKRNSLKENHVLGCPKTPTYVSGPLH